MKRLNMPVQNWKSVVASLLAAAISTASPVMAGDIIVDGVGTAPNYATLEAGKGVPLDYSTIPSPARLSQRKLSPMR